MKREYDMYCLNCGVSLPINSFHNRLYCKKCIKNKKRVRENKRYYIKTTRETYQTIKVILLQSPYFTGSNLLKPMESLLNS